MLKIIKASIGFFYNNLHLNKYDKAYIRHNKKKWKSYIPTKDNKKIILVDLFPWNPFIHFWSYLTNILSKNFDAEIKFFYFDLYGGRLSRASLFIYKLKKIFKSFNVSEGISEYNFRYSQNELSRYEKLFDKFGRNKRKLLNYRKDDIKIGDLIYDTYLRIAYKPTIDLNDKKFRLIFFRAEKIYEECKNYFKINNVVCVVPSHTCYINFGIISRLALKLNIPVIKIRPENRGNALFKLIKIDSKYKVDEFPYYNYKKIFRKFSNKKKIEGLKIGKKLLSLRISGKYDKNLPFMPISQFSKNLKINKKIKIRQKEKIIIFPHCYFDNPHRFRYMIFEDFYEQIKYFLDLSKKLNNYDWYYKPHPNELRGDLDVHKTLLKDFPNIQYLDKTTGHNNIIKLNPKCIITNHGTIAHEYAAFDIPVINTGDNHHVDYDFSLHIKSKKKLDEVMYNLEKYCKKINFNKQLIYEFFYMHFHYFPNLNNENILLKNNFFADKNIKINNSSKLLYKFSKQSNLTDTNIKKYVRDFLDKNLK
jgi:hypothetical protein